MIELIQARHRVRKLREILLRERDLLRRGQYQELADIEGLTDHALAALLNVRHDVARRIEQDIRAIRSEAGRNRDLLQAALKGMNSARSQIADLQAQRDGLGVYTSAGNRVDIPVRRTGNIHRY